ncbi:hypothetical protein F2Q69_00027724 [Brassica cretica]|uniref:Uncharacterized protein n=1 Tax=Brassica cretica TaxID=69181 RepID=A0A8S9S7U7_BRACR|nr:hypothetical protein F2Q69_00027724 [Brassica cretica]
MYKRYFWHPAGAGKILLLHPSSCFDPLSSLSSLRLVLVSGFECLSSKWSPITFLGFDGLSSRMVSSAGYVASSDVIVGSGGWFPGPLQRRGGVLPILLKSGDRFDGLFDTEMSCGPLYAGDSVDLLISDSPILSLSCSSARWRRPSLLEVRPLGVIVRFLSSLTQVDFIACHGFPIICFSKSAKVFLDSLCAGRYSLKEVFGGEFREAYEFRQIHREPITLEVTPEVPTSEARR